MRVLTGLFLAFLLSISTATAQDTPRTSPDPDSESTTDDSSESVPWVKRWKHFREATRDVSEFDYKDGLFRMRFGVRFQIDTTLGGEDTAIESMFGSTDASVDARRGRVFADGDFLRRYHFRFEYDLTGDDGLKDAYIDGIFQRAFKYAALRIGNTKEPFSMERHTSSNDVAFMERSLPVTAFSPGHNFGIVLHGVDEIPRFQWAIGVLTNTKFDQDNSSAADSAFTIRLSALPLYKNEGRWLMHLGGSYSVRNPADDSVRYVTHPEARFTPIYLDTGFIPTDENTLTGLEFALVQGPTWIQAEWIRSSVDSMTMGAADFSGSYAQVGWFLTGETRPYKNDPGVFGRVKPKRPYRGGNPFGKDVPFGAVEFVARLSNLDLVDGPFNAGEMRDLSFGVNWYLTRATRLSANYVRANVDNVGTSNTFVVRYQFNPGYKWPLLHPKRGSYW